ncbi:hypothetical protein D9611_006429 [Ephemerocybe angulata]|uniref:DWNN-domain-containing protein n=1 Tax=Ephemerocybe angulata TaxID=980116 RepID=A0A8H5FG88_9AGAR|nr:hypothetical protein D9611_006429 [Tulosesus angulatus]
MASSVFYKWASRKDESRVQFDGTGITVFDLKREIILSNNLVKGNDFDVHVYDPATNQELRDDAHIIPRSSSVIAKRLPVFRPAKSRIPIYIGNAPGAIPTSDTVIRGTTTWHKGALSKRFDGKEEPSPLKPAPAAPVASAIVKEDEAAAMAAIFSAQTQNWEETQEKMSQATPIYNNPRGGGAFGRTPKPHLTSDRPLPPSYVCYRCGQKGHWIQDCPTNNDRDFDNRPRIKRTTGIPRSMLKAVENPNGAEIGQGVMVTPDGGYVVAQPDLTSWQKKISKPKAITLSDIRERTPSDPSLACPIDNKLFQEAVKTPCCGTAYCEECIQSHLLDRDFVCPNCNKKIASLDKLVPDIATRAKVSAYIDKTLEDSRKEVEAAGGAIGGGDGDENEQDIYSDQQPGDLSMDISQAVVDQIPQLQASIAQISKMLQNSSLPPNVRHQTEIQHQQLQMQLQEASMMALAISTLQQQQQQQQQQQAQQAQALTNSSMGYNGAGYQQQQPSWTSQYISQQPGPDSAYQRLPVNNRRRNLKRDRPSDFLEVGGDGDGNKVARYWE